jgi:transcriptional regulator with XRE-family HTH domain
MQQDKAKAIGDRLRVLILQKGWNQSELARRSRITPTSVSNYVRGMHVPHPRQLAKLAETLGTTPEDILTANGEMAAGSRPVCLTPVDKRIGHLRLQVDQVVPAEVATQVIALLLSRVSDGVDEAPHIEDHAEEEELDAEMPRVRAGGRNILETLLPANPPTPINAKQVRPLDGPAPADVFDKRRRVG